MPAPKLIFWGNGSLCRHDPYPLTQKGHRPPAEPHPLCLLLSKCHLPPAYSDEIQRFCLVVVALHMVLILLLLWHVNNSEHQSGLQRFGLKKTRKPADQQKTEKMDEHHLNATHQITVMTIFDVHNVMLCLQLCYSLVSLSSFVLRFDAVRLFPFFLFPRDIPD